MIGVSNSEEEESAVAGILRCLVKQGMEAIEHRWGKSVLNWKETTLRNRNFFSIFFSLLGRATSGSSLLGRPYGLVITRNSCKRFVKCRHRGCTTMT